MATEIKLAFLGDLMLGGGVNEKIKVNSPEYIWGSTLPLIRRANYVFGNLECVMSNSGIEWGETDKQFHFRSDISNIVALKAANIRMISLANNHSLDYGAEALEEEISLLNQAKIKFAGAGWNDSEARAVVYEQVNHERIGMLSFTDNMPEWEAKNDQAGIYYMPISLKDERTKQLLSNVNKAQKECDWLIAAVHWGSNWGETPPEEHVEFGHALVDAGVKIVYGHSPHICRGVEIYNDGLIMYSTGDFIDDYTVDEKERNDLSMIFGVEGNKGNIDKVYFYPTLIKDDQARMAEEPEKGIITRRMKKLCEDLGTKTNWNSTRGRLEIVR